MKTFSLILAAALLTLAFPAYAGGPHGGTHLFVPSASVDGSSVVVTWKGTPGNQQDWVTVVKAGTPDEEWGTWTYTAGKKNGSFTAMILTDGRYEARLYYDYPKGGFKVIERVAFSVKVGAPKGDYMSLAKGLFEAGETVVVSRFETPGNKQDWITVVKAGTADTAWGKWTYLAGARSGKFEVKGLAAGDYEARLYYDYPKGGFKVIERLLFAVK